MAPMALQRGTKAVMLRAGRVPVMDGRHVDLTSAELAQLRRDGIFPTKQAEPRPFKTTISDPGLGVTLNVTIKGVPPGELFDKKHAPDPGPETVEIEVEGELEDEDRGTERGPTKAGLTSEGWDLIGLPDEPTGER